MGRAGSTIAHTTASAGITATPATVAEVGSPRYKAVRRVKNVSTNAFDQRIALYTRSIAAAKDAAKVKVLQGKIEALQFAKQVVSEA